MNSDKEPAIKSGVMVMVVVVVVGCVCVCVYVCVLCGGIEGEDWQIRKTFLARGTSKYKKSGVEKVLVC